MLAGGDSAQEIDQLWPAHRTPDNAIRRLRDVAVQFHAMLQNDHSLASGRFDPTHDLLQVLRHRSRKEHDGRAEAVNSLS